MKRFAAFGLVAMGMLAMACDQTTTSPDQAMLEPPISSFPRPAS